MHNPSNRRLRTLVRGLNHLTQITRREACLGVGAAGAAAFGISLMNLFDSVANASNSVVTRKPAHKLTANDPEAKLLRDAVRVLKDRNPTPHGWAHLATYHKEFCAPGWPSIDWNREVHFGWWFLPWHRAYLAVFEKHLQAAVSEPSLSLTYWDWYESRRIPSIFTGMSNPLADPTRDLASPQMTNLDLGYATEQQLVRFGSFQEFAGDAPPSGVGPSGARPGHMEGGPHGGGHNYVGGNMADFSTAALDPIFLAHHGNIDRLWEVWRNSTPPGEQPRGEPGSDRWKTREFSFLSSNGETIKWNALQTIRTEDLGYKYDNVQPKGPLVALTVADRMSTPLSGVDGDLALSLKSAAGRERGFIIGREGVSVTPLLPAMEGISAPLSTTPISEIAKLRRVLVRFRGLVIPSTAVAVAVFVNPQKEISVLGPNDASYGGAINLVPRKAPQAGSISVDAELEITTQALDSGGTVRDLRIGVVPYDRAGNRLTSEVEIQQLELILR